MANGHIHGSIRRPVSTSTTLWTVGITSLLLAAFGLHRGLVDTNTMFQRLGRRAVAVGYDNGCAGAPRPSSPTMTPSDLDDPIEDDKSLEGKDEANNADDERNVGDHRGDDDEPSAIPGTLGVDPAYVEIFKEAERRSDGDFRTSHGLGERGIVIGPTEGKFDRHTLKALRNGRRIRNVLGGEDVQYKSVKLALITSIEHASILGNCSASSKSEACRLWANGALFDDVITTPSEPPYKYDDKNTNLEQGSSKYWQKKLGGYLTAPYKHSLFLDSDSFPCPGVEKLFLLTDPRSGGNFGKQWQLPISAPGDFAIGVEQYQAKKHEGWIPGDPTLLPDSIYFSTRNTGAVLFSFERKIAHTLAHFIPLVSEHVFTNVATPQHKVTNDQTPFRMALYLFHRFTSSSSTNNFIEHQIPMHASCRTYPGNNDAGTDGFLNGMYPVQQDGEPCRQCHCTPCLINHNAGSWGVHVNGSYMGWERDYVPA